MEPPPRPEEGVVSWNVGTACNYRCSYCTQRDKKDRTRQAEETDRFLEAFARLPGRWEVKLSGGEPFTHPDLDRIVAGLAALGMRVSVVTNFSSPRERLESFVRAARGRVGVFSASLHLGYVPGAAAVEAFAAKARWLGALLLETADPAVPRPGLCVTTVATREALPRLPALARLIRSEGLAFKVQPEKQDGRVVAYTPAGRALLLELGGHNLLGEIDHRYRGRPCWSGSRAFILDDEGKAFRCYPARRARRDSLGNLLDPSFTLRDGPTPCAYESCHCSVPIARGMMSRTPEEARHALQDV